MSNTRDYNTAEQQAAERIERKAERTMDALDRRFMAGDICRADYDLAVDSLNKWCDDEYAAR